MKKIIKMNRKEIIEIVEKSGDATESLLNLYKYLFGDLFNKLDNIKRPKTNTENNLFISDTIIQKYGSDNSFYILMNIGFDTDESIKEDNYQIEY